MIVLPLADLLVNPVTILTACFIIGILVGRYGFGAGLLTVPALTVLGLPPGFAVGTSIACTFARSAMVLFEENMLKGAYRRVGFVAGIMGLPGIYAGKNLLLHFEEAGYGQIFIMSCYALLLAAAFYIWMRQWHRHRKHEGLGQNPPPPFGLTWRYPLAVPGQSGVAFITVGRVALVGVSLGVLTGLLGPGAGVVGIPLFMYILGFSFTTAAATDILTMLIVGGGALLSYARSGRTEIVLISLVMLSMITGGYIGSISRNFARNPVDSDMEHLKYPKGGDASPKSN